MLATHQADMVKEGLLSRLVELIAVEDEESSDTTVVNSSAIKPILPSLSTDKPEEKDTFYLDILEDLLDYGTMPAEGSKWSCSACTYLNSPSLTSCSICSTLRPKNPVFVPAHPTMVTSSTQTKPNEDLNSTDTDTDTTSHTADTHTATDVTTETTETHPNETQLHTIETLPSPILCTSLQFVS